MKKKLFLLYLLLYSMGSHAQIFDPVKWVFEFKDIPSAEKEIVLKANIEKGWHLYDMDLPEGGPVSTSVSFEVLQGAELVGKPVASAKPVEAFDKDFNMNIRWYANAVSFTQKIKVTDFKKFKASGEVEYMACNDETCLPRERATFSFGGKDIKNIPEEENGSTASTDSLESEDIADSIAVDTADIKAENSAGLTERLLYGHESKIISNDLTGSNSTKKENVSLWTPVIDQLKAMGDETTSATDRSCLYIFIAGFLGGLLALLTPCVWPMIPMTVSFFLKRTKSRKKAISDASLYGLSIIVIYLTMGLLITGIFGASALNNLSTNAIFNIVFFLLLVLFAMSFFGAFELVLPASWTTKIDSKADTTSGLLSIFFMAFTLVLVSFSCTGPIIGTLLVEAASQGSSIAPAVGMFGFALSLAIPFALFAIFPNMLQNMPKSGGWLNSVKVVLGFLELALAFKFLSVADLAYGWRLLDREVFVALWIVIFILLGFYLLGKIRFKHDSELKYVSVSRLFMSILSFAFAIYMLPGLWGAPLKAISAFTPPLYTQDFNMYNEEVHAQFDDYEKGMEKAAKVGKPVLIDFSGYGCVNCRKMEAAVWTDARVKQMIDDDFILITLMVDDKTKLPQSIEIEENGKKRTLRTIGDKWSYLQRSKFGANAQPFYVILDHEGSLLSPSYAYDENVSKYLRFLENGKTKYRLKSNK
ncbi:MAG: thioredoxin family protein [Tannerella sp.]|jgi:thiol:disulfide interchange protein DsbD|nr:thioredoxin family protein [Tannerella sp.]